MSISIHNILSGNLVRVFEKSILKCDFLGGRKVIHGTESVELFRNSSKLSVKCNLRNFALRTRTRDTKTQALCEGSVFNSSESIIQNNSEAEKATLENKFDGLGLSQPLLARMGTIGLSDPTEIQISAIPILLQGQDVAIQSYTGSGKTLAYLLPILSRIGPLSKDWSAPQVGAKGSGSGGIEAVVVAPSRELAMQIVREAEKILGPEYKSSVQQLIGGANQGRQEEAMRRNRPAIVVGTPGRLAELSRAGRLQTHGCQVLVLDESDALLSHKYRTDMLRILDHVGPTRGKQRSPESSKSQSEWRERQTVLVSATMPPALLEASVKWGSRPILVRAKGQQKTDLLSDSESTETESQKSATAAIIEGVKDSLPPNLDHRYIVVPPRYKTDVLRKAIHSLDAKSAIVFMNYGRRLKDAGYKLEARSIESGQLHGGLNKVERANVLSAFRQGKTRVLLVSEVAARGLDVLECDLVVNLELPTDSAHYAHRAGRTGRLGRHGTVLSICQDSEAFVLQKFARQLDIRIDRAEIVEGKLLPFEGRMKY